MRLRSSSIWLLLIALSFLPPGTEARSDASQLLIETGPGRFAGLSWQALELTYRPGQSPEPRWAVHLDKVEATGGLTIGSVSMVCQSNEPSPRAGCRDAQLAWGQGDDRIEMKLGFELRSVDDRRELTIEAEQWTLAASGPVDEPGRWRGGLALRGLDLGEWGAPLRRLTGLAWLEARVSGELRFDAARLSANLSISDLAFDTPDGLAAGGDLALSLAVDVDLTDSATPFDLRLLLESGELLAGPLYLPSPEQALSLTLTGRHPVPDQIIIDEFRLRDPGALDVDGRLRMRSSESGWVAQTVDIDAIALELPRGWERWLDGWAGTVGLAGLETAGRVSAQAAVGADRSVQLSARLDSISVDDPAERFSLMGLQGSVALNRDGPQADLDWQGLTIYELPLREARLRLASDENGPRLSEPLRLPVLDGALVLEQLRVPADSSSSALVELDARIEPVSLGPLTRQLGLTEFGGRLSGQFPGVRLSGDRIDFAGGIDINAFSGSINLTDLVIERPFGTLPALAADVTLTRLDLLQLTGAFDFGRMEGQVSGWVRGLRLLDWRPVAMDARLFTHDDVPRRRISQRAVDNLSSLGGGGGALMTGTVLSVFEDFPYQRAGLACRLASNICHVDGVAAHESGGFYIVEGRGLPRLDVIGHRRLVDWPLMLRQLESIAQ